MNVRISKADKSVHGTIQLPPSKSIYNRVLIIQSLCNKTFNIFPQPTAHDTFLLNNLLNSDSATLNAADAGTTFRFLSAFLAQKPGEWLLTGTERMNERPIGILVDALNQLGAEISYAGKAGFPPLKINGRKLRGGYLKINGGVSSQFISALLLIAPVIEGGVKIELEGKIQSEPYIKMTLSLMEEFGIEYKWNQNIINIRQQEYTGKDYTVEPDWSSASYWYELVALSDDANIILTGITRESIQGDAIVSELMKQVGVESSIINKGIQLRKVKTELPELFSFNFSSCPDLAQTMATTCAALKIKAELQGVQSLRIKETDRLTALKAELEKTGSIVEVNSSTLTIKDFVLKPGNSKISFETYNDHRMALALSPLSLKFPEIEIKNSEVVKKSYPGFFKDLEDLGFALQYN
jgi:3-phosphoshikimate 1-carboxyvinyltransferase